MSNSINRDILQVLTAEKKAECKESYSAVIKAGYKINKDGESFCIRNEHTNRYVQLHYHYNYRTHHADFKISTNNMKTYYLSGYKRMTIEELEKVDWVEMLKKPFNNAYDHALFARKALNRSRAYLNYESLKSKRWFIKHHVEHIEALRKHMEQIQKQLEYEYETKARCEAEYKAYRKEIGLK